MFIELTHKESELPVTINLRDIATILPLEDNTTRLSHISNGEYVDFIESYSRVKELIEREVQAERGYWYGVTTIIRNTKETRRKNCERERFRGCRFTR